MDEFWESSFKEKNEMWGMNPDESATFAAESFSRLGYKTVLIPGFGYGRNAKAFLDHGIRVTGIEISKSAIELSRKHFGDEITIHHGPVSGMPFDEETYDGIYCYSLIHLLDALERTELIRKCYDQLALNGRMIFITISKSDPRYGKGKEIQANTFEMPYGVTLFFYDSSSIENDFKKYGLIEAIELVDRDKGGAVPLSFWQITCVKTSL